MTDKTQLYFVGGGIASLSGAVFAIRDGNIQGNNIHIFESMHVMGGSLDGKFTPSKKFFMRGARKYNIEVFQCTWDLLSAIPSLNNPKKTLEDEFLEFNKAHKKNAQSRLIDKNGNKDNVTSWGLNLRDIFKIAWLIFVPEDWIDDRRIDSWFSPSFFKTNFWYVFASMFGFETWSDLVECKRYFRRFLHDLDKMVRGTGEVTTRYNQYDSMVLPITRWLQQEGVNFKFECKVIDLDFKPAVNEYTVEKIHYLHHGEKKEIKISENDFVFITNGSMTADSRKGSMTTAPALERGEMDGSWVLWENIIKSAKKHLFSTDNTKTINPTDFGNPYVFTDLIEKTMWVTFSVSSEDKTFIKLFEHYTGNKPGQADLVTFKDSKWLLSIHVPFNPHFINQPSEMIFWGGYGLIANVEGDFVKKKMAECSGAEILTVVCHLLGFVKELPHILKTSTCIPNLMPYECAQFTPRKKSDRPMVVPKGSTNLAFMGQFTESGECVYLVESSVRCAMIAVCTLLGLEKKVPSVYTGVHSPAVWLRMLRIIFK